MLSFSSEQEFVSLLELLSNTDVDNFSKIPILEGFISERVFINQLLDLSDDQFIIKTKEGSLGTEGFEIDDVLLSSVINPFHQIRIANIIYEINNDYTFAYTTCEDKSVIESFRKNPSITIVKQNKFTKITDKVFVFKTSNIGESFDDNIDVRDAERVSVDYSNGKRRVKGKMFHTNWGFYTSLGVKTINYKKKFGIWFRAATDHINVSWNINIMPNPPKAETDPCTEANICLGRCPIRGAVWSGNESKSDDSEIVKLWVWKVGIGVTFTDGNIDGYDLPTGDPIKIVRHSANNLISISNHSVNTGCCGTINTPTIQWKSCI